MKTNLQNLNWAVKLLSLMIVLQSCNVYQSHTSSLEQALASNNHVKIVLDSGDKYSFNKLQKKEGKIYGLKNNRSRSFQYWSSRNALPSDKQTMTYVQIYDNELKNIHLKNKSASTVITVLIPTATVGALVGLLYIAANDLELDWSNVDID